MKRIASSDAVAVAPTYSADAGSQGHFGESPNPTHVTAKWMESVQEGLCRTISNAGETLTDDMDQFPNVVNGVHGIKSHATSTGSATTPKKRVAVATTMSLASGEDSLVAANAGSIASGDNSACVAGLTGVSSGLGSFVGGGNTTTASGTGAATLGGASSTASGARSVAVGGTTNTVSGDDSAIVGATSSTATSTKCVVVGGTSHNATGANSGCFGGNDSDATAAQAVCVGGDGNDATGTNSATVGGSSNAASGTRAVAIGGTSHIASATDSACVGGNNNEVSTGAASVAVGGTSNTVTGADSGSLAGVGHTVSGMQSVALGGESSTVAGDYAAALGMTGSRVTSNADRSVLIGAQNCELNTALAVAGGYSGTALTPDGTDNNLTWRIKSSDGTMVLSSTLTQSGDPNADYAELFENAELGQIPPGSLVARTGRRVRIAKPGDRVLGVVSAAPAFLAGGTGELGWAKRHMTDEWGRVVTEDVPVLDADGNARYVLTVPKASEQWDPARKNVPRTQRPDEWTAVALLGQVRVRIGPGVTVGDMLVPGPNGCAVAGEVWGRPVEVMEIAIPYNKARGYGVALCLVG